jgi:CRISPR-associated protein Csd1
MIIKALAEAYDWIVNNPDIEISRDGFCFERVPYFAIIDNNGNLKELIPNNNTVIIKGKQKEEIKKEKLPARISPRTSVMPNFLCDSFSYVFGLEEEKGSLVVTDKALKSFSLFKKRILTDLQEINNSCATAIKNFYNNWSPENNTGNEIFFNLNGESKKVKGNLSTKIIVFAVDDITKKSIDDIDILNYWNNTLNTISSDDNVIQGQCGITGKCEQAISRTHILIKGLMGAQSSGASIVSFNAPAFESYSKSQSYNASVSEEIMQKYTSALNYFLLSGSRNKTCIGKDTVIFWAETVSEDYIDETWELLGVQRTNDDAEQTESNIKSALNQIKQGEKPDFDNFNTSADTKFHILILSPTAARISVRRYYNTSFGQFRNNSFQHYQDLLLINSKNEFKQISFWQILDATISSAITEERNKKINPNFDGALFEAALNNTDYPTALFSEMIARVKTDNPNTADDKQQAGKIIDLTYKRCAFIKAYLTRKDRKNNKKEDIKMALNKEYHDEAYLLGRLFAVLEKVQVAAINPNSTIKDRFFASACAAPASVFPTLLKGYQNHISKPELENSKVWYEKILEEIIGNLGEFFPVQLNLDGQGKFILGYYQQRTDLWTKSENKENK